jgi:hypothetical protein
LTLQLFKEKAVAPPALGKRLYIRFNKISWSSNLSDNLVEGQDEMVYIHGEGHRVGVAEVNANDGAGVAVVAVGFGVSLGQDNGFLSDSWVLLT